MALFCIGLSGCGLYVIHQSKPAGDHKGVPFFVKAAGCKHEVTRLEPYYVLTMTSKTADKTESETTTLSRSQFNSPEVITLRSKLAKSGTDGAELRAMWDKVRAMHYEPHMPESKVSADDWFVVSDVVAADAYVDYAHPYTLNVRMPLIGSAKADVKLADDGTLTEASAEKEDKTISELFPVKELIKSAAGIVAFDGGPATLELAIEEKGVKYTRRYRIDKLNPPCVATDEQRKEAGAYDLTVEDVTGTKKESEEDSIIVSGSIKMPKQKASKGDTPKSGATEKK
jgi:hypothetical protein